MAFRATLEMDDSMNRTVSKSLDCEASVLAPAITDVAALLTDLEAISDLGVVKVSYSSKDTSGAFDENDPSNVDTGATFRLRTPLGEVVSYEIPENIVGGVLVKPSSGIPFSDYAVNLSAVAGANSLNDSDPESDEAWIIEAIWAVNINTGAEITLAVREGGNEQVISPYGASVASVGRVWIGKITLPPGAFIKAYFWNCALNDDIYLKRHCYGLHRK